MDKNSIKEAIFFDLDGTLWDALVPIKDSWNKAMKDNNLNYEFSLKEITSFMGLTPEETVPLAFKDVPFDTGLKYFKIALNEEIKYLKNHPGILYQNEEEILKILASKYSLFIVSNADKGYVENYLNAYNFHKYFKDFIQAGDLGLEKWENILYLKNKYQIEKIIYIGDTNKDRIESQKADVSFIHARYGFGEIKEDVPFVNSIKELPDLIEKTFKS